MPRISRQHSLNLSIWVVNISSVKTNMDPICNRVDHLIELCPDILVVLPDQLGHLEEVLVAALHLLDHVGVGLQTFCQRVHLNNLMER